tara:strand:- start:522 stop:1763 length:1242 start_codon:yes stop_codon:yes gene_type:complete
MTKDSKRAIIVGIFTLFMLILVGGLLVWQSSAFKRVSGYTLVGRFDHVGGIINGAAVRYRGYTVGKVDNITPKPEYIDVTFFVEGHIKIPKQSTVKILFDGLVGENYVQINPNLIVDGFMQDNDVIYGKSGSDLANFIDLGSQNLLHTEDILLAMKRLISDDDLLISIRSIAKNINDITLAVAEVSDQTDVAMLLNDAQLTLDAVNSIVNRLGSDDNFAYIEQSLKQINDTAIAIAATKNIESIDSILTNLEQASLGVNQLLGNKQSGSVVGFIEKLKRLKVNTATQVAYNGVNQTGYFDSVVAIKAGKTGLIGGIGNQSGEIKWQHFQQFYRFSHLLSGRVGIFYNQEGIGFDLYPTKRISLFTDIYDLDNVYYKVGSRYAIRDYIALELLYRKDSVLTTGGVDLGVNFSLK